MSNLSVVERAIMLTRTVGSHVATDNLSRLVDGDLRHIGDAILSGRDIRSKKVGHWKKYTSFNFAAPASDYTIVQEWWEGLRDGQKVLLMYRRELYLCEWSDEDKAPIVYGGTASLPLFQCAPASLAEVRSYIIEGTSS